MHATTTSTLAQSVAAPAATEKHSLWGTSIRFTVIATLLLGIGYPLVVTGLAQLLMPHQANGSLI